MKASHVLIGAGCAVAAYLAYKHFVAPKAPAPAPTQPTQPGGTTPAPSNPFSAAIASLFGGGGGTLGGLFGGIAGSLLPPLGVPLSSSEQFDATRPVLSNAPGADATSILTWA